MDGGVVTIKMATFLRSPQFIGGHVACKIISNALSQTLNGQILWWDEDWSARSDGRHGDNPDHLEVRETPNTDSAMGLRKPWCQTTLHI